MEKVRITLHDVSHTSIRFQVRPSARQPTTAPESINPMKSPTNPARCLAQGRVRTRWKWVACRLIPPAYLYMGGRSDFWGVEGIRSGLTGHGPQCLLDFAVITAQFTELLPATPRFPQNRSKLTIIESGFGTLSLREKSLSHGRLTAPVAAFGDSSKTCSGGKYTARRST